MTELTQEEKTGITNYHGYYELSLVRYKIVLWCVDIA